ncbi:MAG: hypothetical protein JSS82_15565 [Bacteroidetes bacterium]|nr:hypothetical protein [Bacteroidota bacterium]
MNEADFLSLSQAQAANLLAEQAYKDAIFAERARHQEAIRKRAQTIFLCENDDEGKEIAAELKLCSDSFFYWVENYVWIEEPRSDIQKIPMLLYPYQVEAAQKILDLLDDSVKNMKKYDILVEKTRDMGWTWLLVTIAVWFWLFHNRTSLFGSRKQDLADTLGDMKSILEKGRYIIRNLPDWMLPKNMRLDKHMGHLLLRNPEGGLITGEAACPDFGRGDRKFFIVLDESASWAYDYAAAQACGNSTSVRIFISTPRGPFNKFAAMRRGEDNVKPVILTSHWTKHPIKAAGLSRDENGKPTSPWYREECKNKSDDEIAAELDICYESSTKGKVFGDYVPEWHHKKGLKPQDGRPIIRVWDPGLTFFVLFLQVDSYRRVLVLREMCREDAHIRDVASEVLSVSELEFPGFTFEDYGDPNGARRQNSAMEMPEFSTLQDEFDIYVDTNFDGATEHQRVKSRIQAIHNKLREQLAPIKSQAFLIDPDQCPILDRALSEGYRYKVDKYTKRVTEQIDEEHPYEDAVDCLGMGILATIGLGTNKASKPSLKVAKNVVNWATFQNRRKKQGWF